MRGMGASHKSLLTDVACRYQRAVKHDPSVQPSVEAVRARLQAMENDDDIDMSAAGAIAKDGRGLAGLSLPPGHVAGGLVFESKLADSTQRSGTYFFLVYCPHMYMDAWRSLKCMLVWGSLSLPDCLRSTQTMRR